MESDVAGPHPQLEQAILAKAKQQQRESAAVGVDGVNNGVFGGALNDYGCGRDRAAQQWLSQPSVQQALHVNPNTVGMNYNVSCTRVLAS